MLIFFQLFLYTKSQNKLKGLLTFWTMTFKNYHLVWEHRYFHQYITFFLVILTTFNFCEASRGNAHTHTQCVFHIIRLRLIIFHTPKFFNGDFHFNFFFINFFYVCIPCMKNGGNFSVYGHLIMVIGGQFEMVINWGYILKSCSTYNFYVF